MDQRPFGQTAGFGVLFDLTFTRFVTVGVIRIIYLLGIVLLALGWFVLVITAFTQSFFTGLLALVVVTLLTLLNLLFFRMWLELVVVIFRIGENTSILAGRSDGSSGAGGFPVMPPAAPLAGFPPPSPNSAQPNSAPPIE